MHPNDTTRWQAQREFHCHHWVDGAVVYDTASGDTHHLTLAAFHILQRIQRSPCTLQGLAECLLSSSAPNDADHATIEAIVLNLNALGLIEPAPL